MKKIPCQYAIVRFSPFVGTGEFANVGLLLMAPKHDYYGYKLELKRYGRITRFFDDLEPNIYRNSIKNLDVELKRIEIMLKIHGYGKRFQTNDMTFAQGLFHEIVRPRETIIKFSDTRVVLADNPKKKLDELFAYYVGRSFVTKEYRETVLTRGIRKWLTSANIADRFIKAQVGDEKYHWNFPFVEYKNDHPIKIIKPLFLGHEEPALSR